MDKAVVRDPNLVGGDPKWSDLIRTRIVDRLLGLRVASERYRDAVPNESGCLFPFFCRNQVQRAELVVWTPPAPVRQFLFHRSTSTCVTSRPLAEGTRSCWTLQETGGREHNANRDDATRCICVGAIGPPNLPIVVDGVAVTTARGTRVCGTIARSEQAVRRRPHTLCLCSPPRHRHRAVAPNRRNTVVYGQCGPRTIAVYRVGLAMPSGSSPRNSASSNRAPCMMPSSA